MKFIKSLAISIVLLTATASSAFSQVNSQQVAEDTKTASIKVKGITCSTDLKMISTNVEKIKGVSSCTAGKKGTTTTFEVKYNPASVTEKEIYATIENTGSCEDPDERPYKVKQ